MKAIVHNFYTLETDGSGLYAVVYSGPSAKTSLVKEFKGSDALKQAKAFLLSL